MFITVPNGKNIRRGKSTYQLFLPRLIHRVSEITNVSNEASNYYAVITYSTLKYAS